MPSEIQTKLDAVATIVCTLHSPALPNGDIRQSTIIANASQRPGALIQVRITVGTTPTAGSNINIYLIRGNGSGYRSDGAGAADAALVPPGGEPNMKLLGSIYVPVATSNVQYFKDIDTLVAGAGHLGTEWGIAIENQTGAALNTTAANHVLQQQMYVPESQ